MKSIKLNGLKRLFKEEAPDIDYNNLMTSVSGAFENAKTQNSVDVWKSFINDYQSLSDENIKEVNKMFDYATKQIETLNKKDVNPTDDRNENNTTKVAEDSVLIKSDSNSEINGEDFWVEYGNDFAVIKTKLREQIKKDFVESEFGSNYIFGKETAGTEINGKINVVAKPSKTERKRNVIDIDAGNESENFKNDFVKFLDGYYCVIPYNKNGIKSMEFKFSSIENKDELSINGIASHDKPSLKVIVTAVVNKDDSTKNIFNGVDLYFVFRNISFVDKSGNKVEYNKSADTKKACIISNVMEGNVFKIGDGEDYSNYVKTSFPKNKFSESDSVIIRKYLIALLSSSKNGKITKGMDLLKASLTGENFDNANLKSDIIFEMDNPITDLSISDDEAKTIRNYQGTIRLDFSEVFGSFATASSLVAEKIIDSNNVNVEFPISSTEPLVDSYITGELTKTREKIKISSKYGHGGKPSSASMWEIVNDYLHEDSKRYSAYQNEYPEAVAMNDWMYENITKGDDLHKSYVSIANLVWDTIKGTEKLNWITKQQIENVIGSDVANYIANCGIDIKKENINGDTNYCNELLKLLRAMITPQYSNELNSIIKEEVESIRIENPSIKTVKKDLFDIINEGKDTLTIEKDAFKNIINSIKTKNNEYIRGVILRLLCRVFTDTVNNNGVVDDVNRIFFETFDVFLQVYLKEFNDIVTLDKFKFEIKIMYDGKDISDFKRYNYKLVMSPSLSSDGKFTTTKLTMQATKV